jgi:hypothetical protein
MSFTYCKTHDCDYDDCETTYRNLDFQCERFTTTTGEDWHDAKELVLGG